MNEGRALSARHDDDDDFVPASPLFEKHLDASSGRYYYINSVTGESTWDVPHGSHIPLSVKEHSNPTYTNAADHAGDEEDASELILVGKQHIRPKENRIDDHHSILQRRIHNNHDDESSSSSSGNEEEEERGVSGAMARIYNPEERIPLLLVHGMLHLVGYDHIEDDDFELMVKREEEVVDKLRKRMESYNK